MEPRIVKEGRARVIAREAQLLLRAIPSEKWLRALEPSLATRARKACTALATIADETDMALALLRAAVAQSPAEAAEYADDFLQKWKLRLSPQQEYPPEMMQYFAFYRDAMPMAPLTRGRQHRNLDRLAALVGALRAAAVEPRDLPSLVPAFQACHALTEVYDRADIRRMFGTVEAMPPQTAALLANTMGASLNGDWRSRAAQKATGTKRSDTEVALLVDKGYGLALELAESALAHKPGSWDLAAMEPHLRPHAVQAAADCSQRSGEGQRVSQGGLRHVWPGGGRLCGRARQGRGARRPHRPPALVRRRDGHGGAELPARGRPAEGGHAAGRPDRPDPQVAADASRRGV